jgi:hypothetical protein
VTWADSIKAVFWIVSIGALLFLSAGTLDWPNAWIFMAEFVLGGLALTLWLAWRDPGLFKERMGGPFQKGQQPCSVSPSWFEGFDGVDGGTTCEGQRGARRAIAQHHSL